MSADSTARAKANISSPPSAPPPPFYPGALRKRQLIGEWMDDPSIDPRLHRQALEDLSRLHKVARTESLLWEPIEKELKVIRGRILTVLDLASGTGDLLRALVNRADGRIEGHGVDLSRTAVAESRKQHASAGLEFYQANALGPPMLPGRAAQPDIIICSLFLHHLANGDVVKLIRWMNQAARRMVILVDLERKWLDWWMVWGGVRLLTKSPVVKLDSDLSVRAAFTRNELKALCARAGVRRTNMTRHFPQMMRFTFRTPYWYENKDSVPR